MFLALGAAVVLCGRGYSDSIQFTPGDMLIPDEAATGFSDTRTVTTEATLIGNLRVMLDLAGASGGAFNGDYYAYLTHGSAFVVLLNRPGASAGNPFGYGDDGLSVVFDDLAPDNIHTYQSALGSVLGGPLTGAWAPDGRNVDPNDVLDTSPVTTGLSSFSGLDPNGEWTLFVADLAGGNTGVVVSWGLDFGVVPEGASTGRTMCAITCLLLGVRVAGRWKAGKH